MTTKKRKSVANGRDKAMEMARIPKTERLKIQKKEAKALSENSKTNTK